MTGNGSRKFYSEQEALTIILRETSKSRYEIDMDLVIECLYFLYPANEEEDRAFIERTLPILHRKLGFDKPERRVRGKARAALIAAIIMGVLLAGSLVAYALGFDIIAFFFRGEPEHWLVQVQTEEMSGKPSAENLDIPLENYMIWGDAVVQEIADMGIRPDLPKELPEGYIFAGISIEKVEKFYDELDAIYERSDGSYIELVIRNYRYRFSDSDYKLQKDDSIQETMIHNGIEIGYAQNYDTVGATWMTDNCSVQLYGTITMDTLKRIIRTI